MALARDIRKKWADDKTVFGAWAVLPTGFSAELMCMDGVDYVCIDQQHGLIDYSTSVEMLRAIEARGVVGMTRVPANEAWMIGKALDSGMQGVVVPMVETAEEAAHAVRSCRYTPNGHRSFGPARASMVMDSRDVAVVGDEVLCFVMVETRKGVENIDAICATPGLDGIYVGPADLALGLGLKPDLDKKEPEHAAAVERILAACRAHGIVAGIQCGNGKSANRYAGMGFRFITFVKDTAVIPAAVEKELLAARGDGDKAVSERGYT
jgi:4-hydroxy-2-oxoheptanedioate aldolase